MVHMGIAINCALVLDFRGRRSWTTRESSSLIRSPAAVIHTHAPDSGTFVVLAALTDDGVAYSHAAWRHQVGTYYIQFTTNLTIRQSEISPLLHHVRCRDTIAAVIHCDERRARCKKDEKLTVYDQLTTPDNRGNNCHFFSCAKNKLNQTSWDHLPRVFGSDGLPCMVVAYRCIDCVDRFP